MSHDKWQQAAIAVMAVLGMVIMGCGSAASISVSGAGANAGDTPALASIEDLPLTTSPVVAASSTSLSSKSLAKAATTGVTIKTMSGEDFDQSSSMSMCHSGQMLKSQLGDAGQADLIQCYVQNAFPDMVYDGTAQKGLLTLINDDEEGGPDDEAGFIVEVSATKDADGSINLFTMKACEGDTPVEYINYAIDEDSNITIVSKHSYDEGLESGSHQTTVNGVLNESGDFVSKTITSLHNSVWDGGSSNGQTIVEQTADSATLTAYESGTHNSDQDTFDRVVYAEMELLSSDDLDSIAIGDGAAVFQESGSFEGGVDSYEHSGTEAWLGDTTASTDIESTVYSELGTGDLPALGDEVTITLSEVDAATTCDASDATAIEVDMAVLNTACSHLQIDWSWFSCYDVIENGNEVEEEQGGQESEGPQEGEGPQGEGEE